MLDKTPLLSGVSDIADRYDVFLLDVWGVLHNGIELYPTTKDCLRELLERGKKVLLISNTCNRDNQLADMLDGMGLSADYYDAIFTAGSTCHAGVAQFDGQSCWYIGHETFLTLLEGYQVMVNDTPRGSDFVVNAISGMFPGDHSHLHAKLDEALALKLPMLCANPDLVAHVGDDLMQCAGTFAQYYEDHGGQVYWYGKPHEPIYEAAWEFAGRPDKSRVVAVGDSIRTDIQGANRFGIDSVLNLVGIHREEVLCDKLEEVDADKLSAMLREQPFQPAYVLNGFQW